MKYLLLPVLLLPALAQSAIVFVGRTPVFIPQVVPKPISCEIRYAECLSGQELSPERMQVLINEVLKRKEQPKQIENKKEEKITQPYAVPEKKLTEKQELLQNKLNSVNILK